MSFNDRVFGGLVNWYKSNPAAKAIPLIPKVGAAINVTMGAIAAAYDNHNKLKQKEFYQYLDAHVCKVLTVEEIMSDDFLRPLFQTMKVVENTKRAEKIELFARLFAKYLQGWNVGDSNAYDRYEEYLKILDDMTYTEFQILMLLYGEVQNNPDNPLLERLNDFKDKAEKKLGVPKSEMSGYLTRLARTGFYQLTNGGLSVSSDTGRLTQNFNVFLEYLGLNFIEE